jgi:hypothetical protein
MFSATMTPRTTAIMPAEIAIFFLSIIVPPFSG